MALRDISLNAMGFPRTFTEKTSVPARDAARSIEVVFPQGFDHRLRWVLKQANNGDRQYERDLVLVVCDEDKFPGRWLGGSAWIDHADPEEVNGARLFKGVLESNVSPHERTSFKGPVVKRSPGSQIAPPMLLGPPFNNFITSPTEVAVKWAQGSAAVASLCWEATMYEGLLDKLQGITVPVFYGLFLGDFGGTPMGCMVLEWCPSSGWEMAESPTRDEVRMRGLAVADLHKAQVHHGQLYAQGDALCWLDGRHFLRAQDGSVRVVDFSAAVHHECLGGNNSYWIDAEHLSEDCHCKELTLAMHHASRANAGLLKDVPWIPNPEKPQLEGDSRRISLSSLL